MINTTLIKKWNLASKTKSVRAKPLISIMVDRSVTSKFLVDCIEGKEPLQDGVVICLGEAGDVWQQMPKKLLQKYDVVEIDKDGWMLCNPKPDNAVNCVEITKEMIGSENEYILGKYGEQHEDGLRQFCKEGDFICQDRVDSTDTWIVARKIFLNTYSIKS